MKEEVLKLFTEHQQLAILLSLVLSIVVAVIGVLPSVFITAANILFFGFWQGLFISFLGEALGAVVSFLLYRKGFKKNVATRLQKFPRLQQLLMAKGNRAFGLIFSLRLLPFVPSGLVTFAAAMGKVSLIVFVVASSVGKIPALFLEGASVYGISHSGAPVKIMLVVAAALIFYFVLRPKKLPPNNL